jgi:hypothetical protein
MKLRRSTYLSVALGIAYGITFRLLFAQRSLLSSDLVSVSFFFVVPFVIGFITVYLGTTEGKFGWAYAVFAPWIAILGFLLVAMLLLLEGTVCVLMALPGFLVLSSLGGVLARLLRKAPVPTAATLCSIAMLPIVFGPIERVVPVESTFDTVVTEVRIDAPPEVVWAQITEVAPIAEGELSWGLTRLLGVPQPVEAHMESTPAGWVRNTRWQRGVSFREVITDSREARYLRWTFDFPPSSVPEGVLDDHVMIGGRYFGLIDGGYSLEPSDGGGTRLVLRTRYRVTARPSPYARAWARLVMSDFHRVILELMRDRSEGE